MRGSFLFRNPSKPNPVGGKFHGGQCRPEEDQGAPEVLRVETGSWAYADGGTRFKVFHQKGAARNVKEKLQDAAQVHRFTGVTPTVAVHVLWDFVDVTPKEDDALREDARSAPRGDQPHALRAR